jgi:hypothetical protein
MGQDNNTPRRKKAVREENKEGELEKLSEKQDEKEDCSRSGKVKR